jgi:hypothetical protein
MVTADEIQQRIEQADHARLSARVDVATSIATLILRRAQARTDLAGVEASTAAAIDAAGAVMTVDELAGFTGIPITELRVNGNGKAAPVRKVRAVRTPKARSNPAPTGGGDEEPHDAAAVQE